MPVYYNYDNVLLGTQTTINGAGVNYAFAPTFGGAWRWTGESTSFFVEENDGATTYNGDSIVNEEIDPDERFGGRWEQLANIGGTLYQTIWDYTFELTASDGTVFRVAVIDIDLNNDNDLTDPGEDGYFLIFPDGIPPPDTDLTVGGIIENDGGTPHLGLGGTVVCFASGTAIATDSGPRIIDALRAGDRVATRDHGLQPILWHGETQAHAVGRAAPVIVQTGSLGNARRLILSPQHRVFHESTCAELISGHPEVLIRARDLVNGHGIRRAQGGTVRYHHLLLPQHGLVRANGIWAESFAPGPRALAALGPQARASLHSVLPDPGIYGPDILPTLKPFEARLVSAATRPPQIVIPSRPARSVKNCHATRPERAPRVACHSIASARRRSAATLTP